MPVRLGEGVFVQFLRLRQLEAGVMPEPDRGLCPEIQDGHSDMEAYYTMPLLTEDGERILGQRFYAAFQCQGFQIVINKQIHTICIYISK